jgi:hypothetical protein
VDAELQLALPLAVRKSLALTDLYQQTAQASALA